MKVKALWGFVGQDGRVLKGQELEVSNEYGHSLIGRGLAQEVKTKAEPKADATKQTGPKENK